ncbi:ArsA family ATPase, partial [Caldalkalibacillus mannanilyticus]|uniref:ArsA family ATPase n=1 Tax=Caldalkalibacillus mannanilyticus TaxID=1418 RepID=UPI00046902D9
HRMWWERRKIINKNSIYQILMRRKNKFALARKHLLDATLTAFVFVLNAEKLPILETEKAVGLLQKYQIPSDYLIINKMYPPYAIDPFLVKRKEQEQKYVDLIEHTFPLHTKKYIPFLAEDITGIDSLQVISQYMYTEKGF